MKQIQAFLLSFLLLFFLFLLDLHLSSLIGVLIPGGFFPIAHLFLLFLLFISLDLSDNQFLFLLFGLGLLYDAYVFHWLGLVTFLLPLLGILLKRFAAVMVVNGWTRLCSVLVLVFAFELASFFLASLLHLTDMATSYFIVYQLAPTLVLNFLLMLLLQPLLEKIYL